MDGLTLSWRSGALHTIIALDDKGKPTGPTTEVFTASASSWSPDSRYVSDVAPLAARVAGDPTAITPADARACLAATTVPEWCNAPVVAPLDPAFAAIVAKSASVGADDAAGRSHSIPDAPLAWRHQPIMWGVSGLAIYCASGPGALVLLISCCAL